MTQAIDYGQAKQELRAWMVKWTGGCNVQAAGWPCGTCTIALLNEMGLTTDHPDYRTHNKPVDRANEVWRAILQIREPRQDAPSRRNGS